MVNLSGEQTVQSYLASLSPQIKHGEITLMIFRTEQHNDSLVKTCWTTIFVRLDQLLDMPARCGMAGLH